MTTTSESFAPANKIASEFLVPLTEVESLHTAGFSYGELMIAYTLAQGSGHEVDTVLSRRKAGEDWGRIAGM